MLLSVLHSFPPRRSSDLLLALTPVTAAQTAGRAADRNVIIMDPLSAGWTFPRAHDVLHPTAPGSVWIAGQIAGILREHGVRPAPPQPDEAGAIICDWSIPAPVPRR